MSAIQPRPADPPHLHLAAIALAYPLLHGTLTYSDAATALARAALRLDLLDDDLSVERFEAMRERLERSLNQACIDIAGDTGIEIRRAVRLCVSRKASILITREVALAINHMDGDLLPTRCIEHIVQEEVLHG